jgi:large subunit ribosomal protein L30
MSSQNSHLPGDGDQSGASPTRRRRGAQAKAPGKLRITYTTSSIGVKQDQKDTVLRLGLRRLGQTVEQPDLPSVRGMIHKVRHLVTVEEVSK